VKKQNYGCLQTLALTLGLLACTGATTSIDVTPHRLAASHAPSTNPLSQLGGTGCQLVVEDMDDADDGYDGDETTFEDGDEAFNCASSEVPTGRAELDVLFSVTNNSGDQAYLSAHRITGALGYYKNSKWIQNSDVRNIRAPFSLPTPQGSRDYLLGVNNITGKGWKVKVGKSQKWYITDTDYFTVYPVEITNEPFLP
jgi:hypothetical protein